MDNTTLTILGMLAAFITASVTAFLAEPVKVYFNNQNKLKRLKVALYKELIIDYDQIEEYLSQQEKQKIEAGKLFADLIIQHSIKTECYKHAIMNELTLFYQLPESILISLLYNTITVLLEKADSKDVELNKLVFSTYAVASKSFIQVLSMSFYTNALDKKLLKKLILEEEYFDMLKRGNEEYLKLENKSLSSAK